MRGLAFCSSDVALGVFVWARGECCPRIPVAQGEMTHFLIADENGALVVSLPGGSVRGGSLGGVGPSSESVGALGVLLNHPVAGKQ